MVTSAPSPSTLHSARPLIDGFAKNIADRLYGPGGPPPGTRFAHLEEVVQKVGGEVQKKLFDLLLTRQAEFLHQHLDEKDRPCPTCGQETHACDPDPCFKITRNGIEVEWLQPQRFCKKCRQAYFPMMKMLGIDFTSYAPATLELIVYAGANKTSFREATVDLKKMSNVTISEKQVERLTKQIGAERVAERDAQVQEFVNHTLMERYDVPKGVTAPADNLVAVVMADAGTLQIRPSTETDSAKQDEWDEEENGPKPSGKCWRQDKVGLAMTMESKVSETDPCPEIPDTFLDPEQVAKIVKGIKKSAALKADDEALDANEGASSEEFSSEEEPNNEYEGPKLKTRQVAASRRTWAEFGVILACMAWLQGFAKATRQAFVADGAKAIWKVWRARFSSYTPILDFIHAMSYIYSAAKAIGVTPQESWQLYARWIRLIWSGEVAKVILILKLWQHEHGEPEKDETGARKEVAKTLGYLQRNAERMKYAEYRKAGLPIVSSLMESMVKQVGRRVKGTEKFWSEEGAEPVLQLRADYLSDGEVMEGYWERRQAASTGQRHYRSRSAA